MSTILKTLKKLEEEKSVLEKKHDLKGLVLQGGGSGGGPEDSGVRGKGRLWGGLLLGGFVLGMGTYFLLDHFGNDEPPSHEVARSSPPAVAAARPPARVTFDHPTGIPLSHIRDTSSYLEVPAFDEPEWIEPETPVMQAEPLQPAAPPAVQRPVSVDGEVEKIDSLIKSVTSQAYRLSGDDASTSPVETHIPGLKVKGIVYFADRHPDNHIYIATASESNVKLKVDEIEQRAVLKAILPNKAVFLYQGKRVELAMGE